MLAAGSKDPAVFCFATAKNARLFHDAPKIAPRYF
jgi:hypothetical protein